MLILASVHWRKINGINFSHYKTFTNILNIWLWTISNKLWSMVNTIVERHSIILMQLLIISSLKSVSWSKYHDTYRIVRWVYRCSPNDTYRTDPKFSDRQDWANSADPDQTALSICIFWMRYSKVKPSCSTFRVITANFRVSKILGFLQYMGKFFETQGLWVTPKWIVWSGPSSNSSRFYACPANL